MHNSIAEQVCRHEWPQNRGSQVKNCERPRTPDAGPRAQQCFLYSVIRCVAVAGYAEQDPAQPRLVAPRELVERGPVAGLSSRYKALVGCGCVPGSVEDSHLTASDRCEREKD